MLRRKTTQDARAEQHLLAMLRQPQQRQCRITQVIERAEKEREIVVAIELEAEVDVALDDASGVAEQLGAELDAAAVVEVGRGVVEEVDLAPKRLKQEAHVAVRAADVEDASAIRDELHLWVYERIEVVDVV